MRRASDQLTSSGPRGDLAQVTATARLLGELLRTDPEYRDRWQRRALRSSSAELNFAAIARVIAEHLWETGERAETETTLARDLKDRVMRALRGTVLTAETLRWFIEAFEIRPDQADQLWSAYSGTEAGFVAYSLAQPRTLIAPQRHRTVAVFEHHRIGADGCTARHTTVHAIAALHEPVDRYMYVPHVQNADVTVVRGGTIARRLPFGSGLEALEIVLTKVIETGRVTSLCYATRFSGDRDRTSEYRRFAHSRTDNVDICVSFDPRCLPAEIWWTVWDDYVGGRVVAEELVTIDAEHTVHRFLSHIEQSVVGFRWRW